MNFFEHQEAARKRTGLLVGLFILALIVIVLVVYSVVAVLYFYGQSSEKDPIEINNAADIIREFWHPELFFIVTTGTLGVIALGSLFKSAELASGGEVVARSLGGRLIPPNATNPLERKILNVVEEMALASGTPVPPVYLLENEEGINAFAAGFSPSDAVIGVTKGCVQTLSRDELQGVIAHEFSHIFNGDMRLNIRLMGILFGLLLLGQIGYWCFRIASQVSFTEGRRSSSDDKKQGNSAAFFVIVGLVIWILGYAGLFFGRLIKAAVSRQREFLADASAVQFTRNPSGIGGALKKIGAVVMGSQLQSPNAEQSSHMFFGNALKPSFFDAALATHPPLPERIRRIDPEFDGNFAKYAAAIQSATTIQDTPPPGTSRGKPATAGFPFGGAIPPMNNPAINNPAIPPIVTGAVLTGAATGTSMGFAPGVTAPRQPTSAGPRNITLGANDASNLVGHFQQSHIDYASQLHQQIPPPLLTAAREPFGARALIYTLLCQTDAEVRPHQLDFLQQMADPGVYQQVDQLLPMVDGLDPHFRLPLVELSLPALKQLSPDQYAKFNDAVYKLIRMDDRTSLFEYALHRMLSRHLEPIFVRKPGNQKQYNYPPDQLLAPCGNLIAMIAYQQGSGSDADVAKSFAAGMSSMGFANAVLPPRSGLGLRQVDESLKLLGTATPSTKQRLIKAAVVTLSVDGKVTTGEAELLRAIADGLGCPMPPITATPA